MTVAGKTSRRLFVHRTMAAQTTTRILAVSSGGGHWVQLNRVVKAFQGCELVFVTVNEAYRSQVPGHRVYIVDDATRWNRWRLARLTIRFLWILLKERPDIVFSTGAAPGCVAIILSHFLRRRTIWLDSIANIEKMSLSGQIVRKYSDLWLTQWQHLAEEQGPEFAGSVF